MENQQKNDMRIKGESIHYLQPVLHDDSHLEVDMEMFAVVLTEPALWGEL